MLLSRVLVAALPAVEGDNADGLLPTLAALPAVVGGDNADGLLPTFATLPAVGGDNAYGLPAIHQFPHIYRAPVLCRLAANLWMSFRLLTLGGAFGNWW